MRSSNEFPRTLRLAGAIVALTAAGGTLVALRGAADTAPVSNGPADTPVPCSETAPARIDQRHKRALLSRSELASMTAEVTPDAGATPELTWQGHDDIPLDVRPPELVPTGVPFGKVAAELGKHFPHMDEEPPSPAYEHAFSSYADNMMARLGLNGDRADLETGTLTLFDRLDQTDADRRAQREMVEGFVRAFADDATLDEITDFIDGAPSDTPSSRRWEYEGVVLNVSTWPNYGSVDLLITGAESTTKGRTTPKPDRS